MSHALTSDKSLGLVDELRRRIALGEWKPGERLPSYSESRVLFGAHSVAVEKAHAQLEREGLIVRERRRGTFVAQRAQHAVKTLSGIIGIAGKGFAFQEYSPYWVKLLRGVREACDEAGSQILLLDYKSNKGWEKVDGVLICDWSNDFTMQWLPPAMPCVALMNPIAGTVSVYADDYGGARAATEYLLRLGHKKIAYLHTTDQGVLPRRVAGWRDALKAAAITPRASWEHEMSGARLDYGDRFVDQGRAEMRVWLQNDWNKQGFSAIIAHNDETAIGIIEALHEAKIRVPQDVSVMGFDGAITREHGMTSLATMQVPLEDIGKASARLLLRQLGGEDIGAQHHVFPIALLEGQSAGHMQEKGVPGKANR